ncbi:relaxin receptor 1 [Carcharodon carcharias]|uniref:relaxin receptor 1 n=1 Tax=Carcharodon carcharias TaxID=13397 RepID=UPI001B7E4D4A|nr:relaxin receptor 1 [Carcharodon carcharias]
MVSGMRDFVARSSNLGLLFLKHRRLRGALTVVFNIMRVFDNGFAHNVLELHRERTGCSLGYFPCGNMSKCLPQLLHCNSVDDCGNEADEENCDDNNGWSELFDLYYGRISKHENELTNCMLGNFSEKCQCKGLELNCEHAGLHSVPLVSSNVLTLRLQINKLRKLYADGFSIYQDLQELNLNYNEITTVSERAFKGLHNLIKLYLSNNHITFLPSGVFEDLQQVQWLILENNRIQKISPKTFLGLKSVILLVLVNNSFHQLPGQPICEEMPKLNWLDFEGNQIESVKNGTFTFCTQLTVLVLRRNKISSIHESAFTPLQRLGELDLSLNRIEELPHNLFKQLRELLQLNISFNIMKQIHADQFDYLEKLKSLSMDGMDLQALRNRIFQPLTNLSHIYFKKFQFCGYAPHVRSCKPNTDGISSLENLLANVLLRVFVWVVSAITCFGNIFVICMRSYIRSENKLHALSIMSLCCADCLMGIYLLLIGSYDLRYRGEYNRHAQMWMDSMQCQITGSLAMLSTEVSVLLLSFLTLEKYLCIVYPFSNLKPGKCRTVSILIFIWFVGFVIAFTPLMNSDFFKNYYGRNGVCFPLLSEQLETDGAQAYSAVIFLGLNLIAFIVIVFSYGSMFYNIHQTSTMATEISNHIKKEVTIAKRFFFIVFTDALCWIPIFILKILSVRQVEIPGTISSWVVVFILPINSALNPILYTLTTRPFKEMILQYWYNYKNRGFINKQSQKNYAPSFILLEMWPLQETIPTVGKSELLQHPSEVSLTRESP